VDDSGAEADDLDRPALADEAAWREERAAVMLYR
jgi:hypothetical protein